MFQFFVKYLNSYYWGRYNLQVADQRVAVSRSVHFARENKHDRACSILFYAS